MHNTMAPWLLRSFLQKSFPTIIVAAVFMLTSMSFVVPAQSQVEIMPSWDYKCLSKSFFISTANFHHVVCCGSMIILEMKPCRKTTFFEPTEPE